MQLAFDMPTGSHPMARNTDPSSSHMAAAMACEFSGTHRDIVLDALKKYGPMTVDQIAARTRLNSQQINKRTPELQRLGQAETVEGRTLLSSSGRLERVWRAL